MYAEGEYYHYMAEPIDSYKGWRIGLPPQWYPTHSNAYYVGVTGGSFTEVSCMGMPSVDRAPEAGEQRVQESVRHGDRAVPHQRRRHGADGRQLGHARRRRRDGPRARADRDRSTASTKGSTTTSLPTTKRPPLPPSVDPGGHGGSHGYLTNEFVDAILEDRKPLVDIARR